MFLQQHLPTTAASFLNLCSNVACNRCLLGYPHKCPKLRIVPEKGLSKEDADKLLLLLVDQVRRCHHYYLNGFCLSLIEGGTTWIFLPTGFGN